MNYQEKVSMITGMLLGDGYARRGKNAQNYNLSCVHSPSQYDYQEWKMCVLSKGLSKKFWMYERQNKIVCYPKLKDKTYTNRVAEIGTSTLVTKIAKQMYQNGRKCVTNDTLSNLTPLGLAIWYADDGNMAYKKKKDGRISARECTLHTQCFTYDENMVIKTYLESLGIVSRIHRARDRWKIWMNTKNSKKFIALIRDEYQKFPKCMQYKLDFKYQVSTS